MVYSSAVIHSNLFYEFRNQLKASRNTNNEFGEDIVNDGVVRLWFLPLILKKTLKLRLILPSGLTTQNFFSCGMNLLVEWWQKVDSKGDYFA